MSTRRWRHDTSLGMPVITGLYPKPDVLVVKALVQGPRPQFHFEQAERPDLSSLTQASSVR